MGLPMWEKMIVSHGELPRGPNDCTKLFPNQSHNFVLQRWLDTHSFPKPTLQDSARFCKTCKDGIWNTSAVLLQDTHSHGGDFLTRPKAADSNLIVCSDGFSPATLPHLLCSSIQQDLLRLCILLLASEIALVLASWCRLVQIAADWCSTCRTLPSYKILRCSTTQTFCFFLAEGQLDEVKDWDVHRHVGNQDKHRKEEECDQPLAPVILQRGLQMKWINCTSPIQQDAWIGRPASSIVMTCESEFVSYKQWNKEFRRSERKAAIHDRLGSPYSISLPHRCLRKCGIPWHTKKTAIHEEYHDISRRCFFKHASQASGVHNMQIISSHR